MRVLHVVNSLDPGGMENGVVNIAAGLAPRGIETHVACLERRGEFAGRPPLTGCVAVMGKQRGFSPKAAWNLSAHISRIRPDIIHSHNLGPLIYSSLATFAGLRLPLLHGEHSQLTDEERTARRLRQRRRLYRTCAAVHTVADGIRDELINLGFSAGKIQTITNGVDTERFKPGDRNTTRHRFGLPADALCIGLVGRFGAFKRHILLIEAVERIAERFPSIHLIFAGVGGPEESAITQRVAASPMRERIHLLGFQRDPLAVYQSLDLLAIPSTNEGLSNAALEAMACGIPALANIHCGHEQVITSDRDGRIANLNTADGLARELADLLIDPARLIDFGQNARKKIESQFSIERMLTSYEQCYRALARA